MCGRFSLNISPEIVKAYFGLDHILDFERRYNIAPTQKVLVIRNDDQNKPVACQLRWGFVPLWMKPENISSKYINARSETIHEKPMFKNSFIKKRCIIVASSFFEWKKSENTKLPYAIATKDKAPLAMAAIWEHWQHSDFGDIDSCAILTTAANDEIKYIHDRMPLLLTKTQIKNWLDRDNNEVDNIKPMLKTPNISLDSYEVSTKVNNPRFEDPSCIEKIAK